MSTITTKIITTTDAAAAERYIDQVNARRARLGIPATHIRSFQKSVGGGDDVFTITIQNGEPVDVMREFSPIF